MKFFIPTLLLLPHLSTPKPLTFPLLPHHVVLSRRLRELPPSQHQQIASLYQGYGTHYVDLWVGSPTPQRQTVIVDTGSQLTAFPCEGCHDCGDTYHTDGYFDYSQSTSFQKVNCDECFVGHCYSSSKEPECHLGLSYQEGSSWAAFEAKDAVYAGGMHDSPIAAGDQSYTFNLVFGCQSSLTGLFKTQLADGIMGMSSERGAFWKQMHEAGMMEKEMFSLCFNRQPVVDREGTLAGVLTLGGTDSRLWDTPLLYAKNVRAGGFYTVHIRKMYLREGGGASAAIGDDDTIITLEAEEGALNTGGVIVDSGTTDTYLNQAIGASFKKAWKKITGEEYDNNEKEMTTEQVLSLPTVFVQLRGEQNPNSDVDQNAPGRSTKLDPDNPYDVLIAIPPEHYMEYIHKTAKFSSRLFVNEYGGNVLGANTMMGHDVVFDDENGRIGFAESNCDYDELTGVATQKDRAKEKKQISPPMGRDKNNDGSDNEKSKEQEDVFGINAGNELEEGNCSSTRCRGFVSLGFLFLVIQAVVAWKHLRPRREFLEMTDETEAETGDYHTTELVAPNPSPVV